LVICYKGEIFCTQSKCAHYGFNLAKGLLIGDKLICPLHNAAFSIKSGHEEQGPVFNGLKTFPVKRENGKIVLSIPADTWNKSPAPRTSAIKEFNKDKKIVIVGGGIAALAAVDSLRETGYDGFIYMVSK
jgi:apoptosis-inducing factor 3